MQNSRLPQPPSARPTPPISAPGGPSTPRTPRLHLLQRSIDGSSSIADSAQSQVDQFTRDIDKKLHPKPSTARRLGDPPSKPSSSSVASVDDAPQQPQATSLSASAIISQQQSQQPPSSPVVRTPSALRGSRARSSSAAGEQTRIASRVTIRSAAPDSEDEVENNNQSGAAAAAADAINHNLSPSSSGSPSPTRRRTRTASAPPTRHHAVNRMRSPSAEGLNRMRASNKRTMSASLVRSGSAGAGATYGKNSPYYSTYTPQGHHLNHNPNFSNNDAWNAATAAAASIGEEEIAELEELREEFRRHLEQKEDEYQDLLAKYIRVKERIVSLTDRNKKLTKDREQLEIQLDYVEMLEKALEKSQAEKKASMESEKYVMYTMLSEVEEMQKLYVSRVAEVDSLKVTLRKELENRHKSHQQQVLAAAAGAASAGASPLVGTQPLSPQISGEQMGWANSVACQTTWRGPYSEDPLVTHKKAEFDKEKALREAVTESATLLAEVIELRATLANADARREAEVEAIRSSAAAKEATLVAEKEQAEKDLPQKIAEIATLQQEIQKMKYLLDRKEQTAKVSHHSATLAAMPESVVEYGLKENVQLKEQNASLQSEIRQMQEEIEQLKRTQIPTPKDPISIA